MHHVTTVERSTVRPLPAGCPGAGGVGILERRARGSDLVHAGGSGVEWVEAEDRWRLPFTGAGLEWCCFGPAVLLRFCSGHDQWQLRIRQPFIIGGPDGEEVLVVPERLIRADAALGLLGLAVGDASVHQDGTLVLRMVDGSLLQVPSDEVFGAWELAGPQGIEVVPLPGSGLLIWSSAWAGGR